jgi:hypothetical protein
LAKGEDAFGAEFSLEICEHCLPVLPGQELLVRLPSSLPDFVWRMRRQFKLLC